MNSTKEGNILNAGQYELRLMISVYERNFNDERVDLEFFLQSHDVKDDGSGTKLVIGPGRPLTEEALFSLGRYLAKRGPDKSTRRRGMLPPNLLYIDGEQQRYVWYKPAHRSPILFSAECEIPDAVISHPTLVFCCHGENLFVYAVKTTTPDASTPLWRAPYLNIHEPEWNLCKGNTNVNSVRKAETHEDLLKAWENIFFRSRFSHGVGTSIQQATKKNNKEYIKLLTRSKTFPNETLKKSNLILKQLCK